MSETRTAPAIRNAVPWLVLTFGMGAVVLFFPLALTIDAVMTVNSYAALPGETAASQANEAMFSARLLGFVSGVIIVGSVVVGGIIAYLGRRRVFMTVLLSVVLMLLVTLPFAWLIVQPA